jgi:hypothetical protein
VALFSPGPSSRKVPSPVPFEGNDTLLFEFSLCLSRACLGKTIVFIRKILHERRQMGFFLTIARESAIAFTWKSAPRRDEPPVAPEEKRSFFERFPYVCPEPVLVKCSFLYIKCIPAREFRAPACRPLLCIASLGKLNRTIWQLQMCEASIDVLNHLNAAQVNLKIPWPCTSAAAMAVAYS